jgi:hypothetical protein
MRRLVCQLGIVACTVAVLLIVTGCHERKHREVRVHEEQHHGEVQEVSPGEPIVE